MVVLLPSETEGLTDLETNLTFDNLQRWMSSLKHEDEVEVYLPRFKTTSQFQLSSTLKAMGMQSAFDRDAADFSGMADNEDLFISAVIHKAFVDVNEEGTEAASPIRWSSATVTDSSLKRPPKKNVEKAKRIRFRRDLPHDTRFHVPCASFLFPISKRTFPGI